CPSPATRRCSGSGTSSDKLGTGRSANRSRCSRSLLRQGGGQLGPLRCRCEALEVDEAAAVDGRMGDVDDPLEIDDRPLVDLLPTKQFLVVAEVSAEPGELPEGFRGAVKPTT